MTILDAIPKNLRINSREYYNSLRDINGRFYHPDISDTMLPGIGLIDTCVKIEDQCIPLYEGLKALRKDAGWHTVLTGEDGMGKTVSVITMWEKFLADKDRTVQLLHKDLIDIFMWLVMVFAYKNYN
jgi:hypothetical protein